MANRKLTETQKQTVKYTRKELSLQSNSNTRWKVHWESTTPRESLSPTLSNTCHTYLFLGTPVHIPSVERCDSVTRVWSFKEVQNVNNRRFSEFFDRYFHIPLPIVTKHEPGLPFLQRNLPIKFGTNPSTIVLVIVVAHRQTHRQTHKATPVKTYFLAFAERKMLH